MSVYNFLAPAYLPVDENHPTDPLQSYGEEKKLAETCCEDYARISGMCIPILRFSGVYGPGKRAGAVYHFIRAVLRGEDVEIQLNRRIDLVYVQDAAEAMVAALEGALRIGLEIINIGAGHSVALVELAELIGRKAGVEMRLDCKAEGNEFYLDITRARQRLGYHPRTLEEGVTRFMRWVQEDEA